MAGGEEVPQLNAQSRTPKVADGKLKRESVSYFTTTTTTTSRQTRPVRRKSNSTTTIILDKEEAEKEDALSFIILIAFIGLVLEEMAPTKDCVKLLSLSLS